MSYAKGVDLLDIRPAVKNALKEDIGAKDITTESLIPKDNFVKAILLTKEDCVVCGLGVAGLVFKLQDKSIKFKPLVREGSFAQKGKTLAIISGKAKSILTAERVALNYLSLLCGISTNTRKFSDAVKPYKVKILDTRKTIPGLRLLEKYAVRIGGAFNHRLSLDEMILIKDNHLKIIAGIDKLTGFNRKYKVEIEVKNLKEFKEALRLCPDMIMLDNISVKNMKEAVKIRNKIHRHHPKLEASGGISLRNIHKVAGCGIDMVSIGELTHSVKSVDISLEIL